jgi:lipoic acid synthetase
MPQQVPDMTEPERVAEAVAILGLRYCVITSVTRDDLTDGGAELWALTIMQIRKWNPNCMVEILVPDFGGNSQSLMTVINARPDVFGHNLETVRSRYPAVRPQADYDRSLMVLEQAARAGLITKTGVMLGLGETGQDLDQLMKDVRLVGCMSITFGQYLQPSIDHLPVDRYIAPSEFKDLETRALMEGFQFVMSGPLVRSSFCADKIRPFLPVK